MSDLLDLVGIPWEEANCAEIARMALERMGQPVLESAIPSSEEAGMEAFRALSGGTGPWAHVGTDYRACDTPGRVVLSQGDEGLHVSVVTEPGYVISSCRLQGSYLTRAARVASVLGVYELR